MNKPLQPAPDLDFDNAFDQAEKLTILQNRQELRDFCAWLKPRQVKHFLEIGTYRGGSFLIWNWLSEPGIHIAIDPNSQNGIQLTKEQLAARAALFTSLKPTIHMISLDSTRAGTARKVEAIIKPNHLDFLFIDGEHSQRACHSDWIMYGALVRPGGVIAFHDAARYESVKTIFAAAQKAAAESRLFTGPGELRGIGAIVTPTAPQKDAMAKKVP
jgi:predicted O-methyltransferase YrrM